MLAEVKVEEIRRLLASRTWSMRQIARMTGTSRGTVAAIAHGTRRDRPARDSSDEPGEEPLGPIERCPQCGGLAHVPCRACRVRRWQRARRQGHRLRSPEGPLELGLVGEDRRRYEEVHLRRLREGPRDEFEEE